MRMFSKQGESLESSLILDAELVRGMSAGDEVEDLEGDEDD